VAFDRMLKRMRDLIRASAYLLTVHGADEIEADGLSIFDVEHCILTGKIVKRQRDRVTGRWKDLVEGSTLTGTRATVVARIGPTGRLVLITVYAQ
jgi:hypothetical protein